VTQEGSQNNLRRVVSHTRHRIIIRANFSTPFSSCCGIFTRQTQLWLCAALLIIQIAKMPIWCLSKFGPLSGGFIVVLNSLPIWF